MADKTRALAAERAAEADWDRRLSADVIDSIRDAGFNRHYAPARWGGNEASFTELTQAVATVGEGCAAAAWCASLFAYASRFASFLPVDGQRELWGSGPDAVVAAGIVPCGTVEPVDSGYRVSGRWQYVSGVEFADWTLVCGPPSAQSTVAARFFALPRGSYQILQTWDAIGMRATGSHTILVDDVFVPEHRTVARVDLMTGHNATSSAACHTAPFAAVGGLTFIGPSLGAAAGALTACVGAVTSKPRIPTTDIAVARAAGQIDAAKLLAERVAATLDHGHPDRAAIARNARDAAVAGELLVSAVTELVRAAGTGGLAESNPLQRFWRDAVIATSHVAVRIETSATGFVESLLTPA